MTDEDKIPDKRISELFKDRLEKELAKNTDEFEDENIGQTRAYDEFKKQYLPSRFNLYEKFCNFSEQTIPFKPDEKKEKELKQAIETCHLNTTPTGVYSAALLIPLILIFTSMIIFFILPIAFGAEGNLFLVMFTLMGGLAMLIPLQNLPLMMADSWKMKASNQMVLAVFYVVTYMRHTSNLELAINFAAEHLGPPLALDMRKIVWNVETETYDSIKESLEAYLLNWRKTNEEFVECMHLIQSSLYESSNDRRLNSLDKALTVMLDGTYEKMIHFAHNLKAPLTTLNMLGVVLPILTLVLLPLVVSFMDGVRWYHLFVFYDIFLPIAVYYLGSKILTTRPGGSGDQDITAKNPELKKLKDLSISFGDKIVYLKPIFLCVTLGLILVIIGFTPLLWHAIGGSDYVLADDGNGLMLSNIDYLDSTARKSYYFLNYRERTVNNEPTGEYVGPFGLGALLFSLLIPLGIGYFMGLYYKLKSQKLVKIRDQSKKLELEFSSALFQLGSRIGDGIPAETAFGKVALMMEDTVSGKFFMLVHVNITRLGMSVEKAIFDKQKGALQYYPSDLIESSMKVLVESSKKGPLVASQALINVSEYMKQMHRVDERLNDLLGDVISSLKGQVKFLTPVISGIVVGITSMITKILGMLGDGMKNLSTQGSGANMMAFFGTGIPTYHFQLIVGLYVVELSYILTVIGSGIETGGEDISKNDSLGSGMIKSTLLYILIAGVSILLFNIVAGSMPQMQ